MLIDQKLNKAVEKISTKIDQSRSPHRNPYIHGVTMTNSVRAGMSSSYKSLDEKTIQIMEKVTRAHEILHSNNR